MMMAKLRRAANLFQPVGAERFKKWAVEFERLGMDRATARQAAMSPAKVAAAGTRELTLLPDGILKDLGTVIDIGANHGEWAECLLTVCPPKRLLAVEPNPTLHANLKARFAGQPVFHLIPAALAREPGELDFHITDDSASASLLKPREQMNQYYGHGFSDQKTIRVPVTTLDALTADVPAVSLIKMDVQGYEMQVLEGATQTLKKTRAVMMEVTFYSHYEGDASFDTLHKFMAKNGFALWNLSMPFKVGGVAMWSDAVYHKVNDDVLTRTMV